METCDSLTIWSANNYKSFTFAGKIITPNTGSFATGNKVPEDIVVYYPKVPANQNPRFRIAAISNISLALIIETSVQDLKKNGVKITNSTKLSTVIQIQIDDNNENNFKLLENIIGIKSSHGESATAVVFDDSVPPSAFLEQEFNNYEFFNNFDLNNL